MSRRWAWETADSEWSVELDERAGLLRWRGLDKPRKGVPDRDLSGGEVDQQVSDLRSTGRPSYACPPEILAQVMSALGPVKRKVPAVERVSIEVVMGFCQAALRDLTGAREDVAATQRQVSVEEVPDDRPTQTSGTRYVTEVRFGDLARFTCVQEVGGFFQGSADWSAADFAGTGPLRLSFENSGVELEGALSVVDVFEALLRAPRRPAGS